MHVTHQSPGFGIPLKLLLNLWLSGDSGYVIHSET